MKQYEIVKRPGSAMDAYTQATYVAKAYLQANNEAKYKEWKAIEKKEGHRTGAPAEMLQ